MRRPLTIFLMILFVATIQFGCSGNKELINTKNMQISALEDRVDSLYTAAEKAREEKESLRRTMEEKISGLQNRLDICLEEKEGMLKISIPGAVRFNFGSAALTGDGKEAVDAVWEALADYPDRRILIEGHTDDVPIDESFRHIYPSNWELSTARASAVMHYLIDHHNADPKRITVSGFSKYHPSADNETPEGRAENRRVVISVRDRK